MIYSGAVANPASTPLSPLHDRLDYHDPRGKIRAEDGGVAICRAEVRLYVFLPSRIKYSFTVLSPVTYLHIFNSAILDWYISEVASLLF
jgi:hypothetical protein